MEFDIEFNRKNLAPDRPISIMISCVSARDWHAQFGFSLFHVGTWTMLHRDQIGLKTLDARFGTHQSSLSASRQHHVDQALKGGYTHIFMVDDDQQFPKDTILRLLAHKKPVVFPNICQKKPDVVSGVVLNFDYKRIDSRGRTGLEQVGCGTLACTLIDLDCIRNIPRPHFEVKWVEGSNRYQGEDHAFFDKMRDAGVEFWVDHDLSQQVWHIGDYPYGFTKANV